MLTLNGSNLSNFQLSSGSRSQVPSTVQLFLPNATPVATLSTRAGEATHPLYPSVLVGCFTIAVYDWCKSPNGGFP